MVQCTVVADLMATEHHNEILRVQSGVRIEARLLKVLKGLAELLDMSLGDLLEGVALHALEGKLPFSAATLEQARKLRKIYQLTLCSADAHTLSERGGNSL